jgi:RPA family protein
MPEPTTTTTEADDTTTDEQDDGPTVINTDTDEAGGRQPARRVFASELNDATYTFREEEDDRAPVFVTLPTGEKANRVFVVGTVTEINDVADGSDEYLQMRLVDPSGSVYAYAGQYQPGPAQFMREAEPPLFAAMTAKPRTYEASTETGDTEIRVSLRPETITEVDRDTRTRWIEEAADKTLARIERFDESNPYCSIASKHYETEPTDYTEAIVEAMHDHPDTPGTDSEAEP